MRVAGSSPATATHQKQVTIMEQTIEQKVAAAILEKATDSIEISGEVYPLGDPCIATLILISELISTMPVVENVPKEQRVYYALHYAKDFKSIGELCAILVLGADNLTEEREITEYKRVWGVFKRKVIHKITIDKKAVLAREISLHVRPSTILNCIIERLQDMEVGHFFSIITSLSEVTF